MLKLIPGNAQHIGARKEQQDSFGFSDTRDAGLVAHGGLLAVVADGMGGLEGGQQSSSVAVQAFLAGYARKTPHEPIPAALRRSLLESNRAVLAVARQAGTEGNTGTTFAAVAMHEDLLYWIAAGDSRIYLLRDGQVAQVNADHTYATTLWAAVAAGRMARETALNDAQAPHLTSHLGMEDLAQIDLSERPYPLLADDVVILCSDGVYRALRESEMVEIFRSAASPSAACEAIQAAVLAKGSARQDNLTILAIQCHGAKRVPTPAAPPEQARSANGKPSHLGLAGVVCVELLMAAGLVARYRRSQPPTAQKQPARGPVESVGNGLPATNGKPANALNPSRQEGLPLLGGPSRGDSRGKAPAAPRAGGSVSTGPPAVPAPRQGAVPEKHEPQSPAPAAAGTGTPAAVASPQDKAAVAPSHPDSVSPPAAPPPQPAETSPPTKSPARQPRGER